ncbi:MAG: RHS repeat-associated core domain-containing protein [Planctomycetota bacterium]
MATATDAAGNSSTDEVTIFVADPNDVEGPVVSITSPGDGDSITAPTDIIGTVLDDTLVSYRLLLAEFGTRDFREIASGTENIDNGVLGQLDPTLLQNASYVLRLEAFDAGGNGNVIEQSVEIIGDLKLGNFQLAFTDLIIPVAGIPIEVTRVYDTLQADVEGDFGFGWRLEFRDTNLQVSLPETGLEEYGIFSAYQPGTRVYLNVPGEGRQGFTFDPIIRTLPGFGNSLVLATPRFIADPGVTSTLSVNRSGNLTVNEFGELSAGGGVPYNPASPDFGGGFTLTTENGIKYKINGLNGKLETAEDRNGNLLTFSESGISSTAGRSVVFNRDLSNRITSIEDPAGNTIEYAYSTSGDLVTVSDRLGQLTQFSYRSDRAHYLDQIIDPLDRPVSRSVYNDEGRLTRVIDVDGVPLEFEYDPDNFISIIEDTDGSTIVIEYDSRGNKRRVTDPSGGVVEYIYDENNFVTQQVDEFGETVSFSYDSSGRELSRTDQLGYIETFTRNAAGQLIASVDKLGNATTFERDTRGNIVAQTDALGNRTEFTVDQRGNVSQIVSPLGSTVQFEYDSLGDLVRQVDPAGVETAAEHDANGNQINAITSVLNPDNSITKVTTSFEYDANGRILAAVDPIGSKREFEYDALGNQIAEIDVNGERTSYEYDGKSRPTKVTYADGTSTETRYDENGNLQAAVGPNGQSTSMVYDASGRLISQVFPDSTPDNDQDNPQLDLDYIGRNRISTISDVSGTVNFVYDAVGNVIEREVEGESSVGFEFDALNRLVSYTDELGEVTGFEFDDVGNLIGITNPDGTTRSSTWDAHGNLISEVDELGNSTFYEYDQLDRLISITDALGQTTQYEYDSLGNLIKQTDALGRATIYTYDLRGFLIATERPLGQTETRQYDAAGQLTSVIDFNGDETQFVYDSRNRVTQQIDVEGSIVNYSYNDSGSIVLVTDGRGETSYEYDERELLTRKVNPDGTELNYEYNQLGDLISISTPRWETSYTYDSQRQIESVSSGSGSTSYTYDAIGNLTVTALPNGTIETRSYTANGLLAAIVVEDANGSIIDSITYEFDNAGKRIGSVDADGRSVDYRYDAIGRLVFESISESGLTLKTIEYAYDAVGNRVSKLDSVEGLSTYQYNENDQLISEVLNGVTTVYTYDANGNQLSERTSASDSTVYSWDTDNRLVSVVTTSPTGTEIVEYEYDHQGNRVSRRINGELTLYLVDSNRELPRVVEELNSVGETERSYAWGNGLISQESNDQTFYYHRNHLGTVRKISSADGSIVNTYNYDAFGNLLDSNETIGNLFRFAGEPFDPITGLTYLRARHLQNSTGRFVSTDPFPGVVDRPFSLHRYQYADANPVSNTDPTGLVTLKEVLIASSIVTGLGALTTGYIAYKAGLDITWEGASAQFVFAPTILGGGIGGTVLTARNQGYETKAYHIQLFAGAVSPNIFSKVADNIGRIGFRSSAGFWREFSRFLFLTPAALPFDITFGTLQLKSPSAFANPYGIESSVLTGFWIQFGVGASGGLASLPALGPTFHANAVGIAGVIQGFGVGTFSVGTSLALAPNVGGSLLAGVSLPTPFGYDNRRIAG